MNVLDWMTLIGNFPFQMMRNLHERGCCWSKCRNGCDFDWQKKIHRAWSPRPPSGSHWFECIYYFEAKCFIIQMLAHLQHHKIYTRLPPIQSQVYQSILHKSSESLYFHCAYLFIIIIFAFPLLSFQINQYFLIQFTFLLHLIMWSNYKSLILSYSITIDSILSSLQVFIFSSQHLT